MKRRLLATAALCALAGMTLPAHAQQTIRLTAAAGHPPVFLWVKLIDEYFIPEVDKRLAAAGGKHKIEWTKAWGGTLIKIGSESKGIADGVADMGFVSTIFEAPKFPMQNVLDQERAGQPGGHGAGQLPHLDQLPDQVGRRLEGQEDHRPRPRCQLDQGHGRCRRRR